MTETPVVRNSSRPSTVTLLWRSERILGAQVVEGVIAAGHDIRSRHSVVLAQLSFAGARITNLARVANVSPQAMSELVDELEKRGLVERRADPSDRRAKLIVLTPAGSAATAAAGTAIERIEASIDDILGVSQHRELRQMLEDIIAAQPGSADVLP